MKKKNLYEDDDFDEEKAEEETDEDDEEEEVPKKSAKPKKKVRKIVEEEEEETKENGNWLVQRIPELLSVVDPQTKKVIAQADTIEGLTLQLQVLATQFASEAARNTR